MGCSFGLNGKMILRESQEVADKLESLKELIGEIEMTCQAKDGLVEVSLSGGYSMAYGTAVEIEKTLRGFSSHITEATYFDTDCDGEEGIIWVGTPENIKQAQRGKLIYETVVLLQQLTPNEIQKALKMASDTKPAAPPDNMTFDGKWRPIDTAPKDTLVLVCRFVNNEWHMCESELYYDAGSEVNNEPPGGWIWSCDHDNDGITMDEGPTYWMPRPSFYEEALADGCEADENEALILRTIRDGFDARFPNMITTTGTHTYVDVDGDSFELIVETDDEFDKAEYGPMSMAEMARGWDVPVKPKDCTDVLDIILFSLSQHEQLAKEITGLTTDGDNHDCEAMFLFRNQAWTIKVR